MAMNTRPILTNSSTGKVGENNWQETNGGAHVYGLARNLVVQAAGTYNTTEVFGFICTTPGSGDWTIDPISGSSVGGIAPTTFTAGQVYPIHAESITVGTGGEAVLFIP